MRELRFVLHRSEWKKKIGEERKKRLSLQETRPVSGGKPAQQANGAGVSRINIAHFLLHFLTGHDFYSRNAISTTRRTICQRKATVNYSFRNIDNQQRRPRRTLLGQGRQYQYHFQLLTRRITNRKIPFPYLNFVWINVGANNF